MELFHCGLAQYCHEATRLPIEGEENPAHQAQYRWQDLLELNCPRCGQRVYFWQGTDARGRMGPIYRIQKPARIRAWLTRKTEHLRATQGSAWVWGSSPEFPYRLRKAWLG